MASVEYCPKASEPSCSAANAANACGPPPTMTMVADSSCRPTSSSMMDCGVSQQIEHLFSKPLGSIVGSGEVSGTPDEKDWEDRA